MQMEMDSIPSPRITLRHPTSDLTLTLSPPPTTPSSPKRNNTVPHRHHLSLLDALKPEERGVRLIQLLLACAAHTATSNVGRADACLRLISALSSPSGDSLQRLAARLASSLATHLLRRRWPGLHSALHHRSSSSLEPKTQQAFARGLPYLHFAHAVTGSTLLRALAHHRVVHLVDLGPSHASVDLWLPVLRALSRLPRGIKLTCVSPVATVLESLGSALTKETETLDVMFQFNPVNSSLRELDMAAVRVRPGETLAVVSILSLHELLAASEAEKKERRCGERVEGFLSELRSLSPKVMVVTEQESDHNSGRMVERFAEVLHYYSGMFDSVEAAALAGMMTEEERAAVEEEILGREMENVVACEGEERVERHERAERWMERMGRAEFRQVTAWSDAGEAGRRVVESWAADGRYSVVVYRNCYSICWHDRPMYTVSAWQVLI